jgi:hypothetical protein
MDSSSENVSSESVSGTFEALGASEWLAREICPRGADEGEEAAKIDSSVETGRISRDEEFQSSG